MQDFQSAAEITLQRYLRTLRLEINSRYLTSEMTPIETDADGWLTTWNGEEFLCMPFFDETDGLSVCHADSGDFTETKWVLTGNLQDDAASFAQNVIAAARFLTGKVG